MNELQETLAEAKNHADKMVANLPYLNQLGGEKFRYKDDEVLLEEESVEDLDNTYVPESNTG